MIKINLLPQKRARLRASAGEPGSRDFLVGLGALAGVALIVFFAVDQPKRAHVRDTRESIRQLDEQIKEKKKKLDGYEDLKAVAKDAEERAQAINRLMNARTIPANVLQELGEILTQNHLPTMTAEMARKTGNTQEGESNKRFDMTWDPQHLWLTSFADTNGNFTIEGGASAEADVIQFSKRLQASVYFSDVGQSRQERVQDKDSGISYYRFTITGKVAY